MRTPDPQRSPENAVVDVERWLRRVVIGEGFCPFAARPYAEDEVYLERAEGGDAEVLARLARRCGQMEAGDSPETALVVLTSVEFGEFGRFVELLGRAEAVVEEFGSGALVLASFHPDYRFGGLPAADIAHHIHRSPWPVLHVLRQRSLRRVARLHPDIASIPDRNRARASELGVRFFAERT